MIAQEAAASTRGHAGGTSDISVLVHSWPDGMLLSYLGKQGQRGWVSEAVLS